MRIPLQYVAVCFAAALPLLSQAQEVADKKNVFVKKQPEIEVCHQMGILLEYFQLDAKKANQLLRKYSPMGSDAKGLRDELDELIENDEAKLLETAYVIARSGQRAKVESIKEYIYPTKYESPEVPTTVGGINIAANENGEKPAQTKILFSEPIPTDFEVRNVGITLEVDPVLSADGQIVDLNLAPEIITLLDTEYYVKPGKEDESTGTTNIKMPVFYTMKNTTQITLQVGKENLFGFHTPHDDPSQRVISMIKVDLIKVPGSPTVN